MFKRLLASAALIAASFVPAHAADDFPDGKTIEVVIHAKYGGGTDTTARMMMIRSRRILDTDMLVVAKRGGGGKGGMTIDGMVGVARAMDDPTFITVRTDSPHKTLEDIIAASKEKPLNWGVAEIGGTEHIGLLKLAKAAGFKVKAVPVGSGAQMVQALMSLGGYPDVPTTFELGYEVKTSTTRGYAVKAGTPEPIVQKLSDALTEAMKHDTFGNYLRSSGLNPEESVAGWQEWDAQLKQEYADAKTAMIELGIIKQ